MNRTRYRITVVLLGLAVVLGGLFGFSDDALRCIGRALVRVDNDVPAVDALLIPTADWIVNDGSTESLVAALELVKHGGAKQLSMTCKSAYGTDSCTLANAVADRRGWERRAVVALFTSEGMPDREEAVAAVRELAKRGVGRLAVMLPNYKTARLGRIYRREGEKVGMRVWVLASRSPEFEPEHWWQSREARKRFFDEMARALL